MPLPFVSASVSFTLLDGTGNLNVLNYCDGQAATAVTAAQQLGPTVPGGVYSTRNVAFWRIRSEQAAPKLGAEFGPWRQQARLRGMQSPLFVSIKLEHRAENRDQPLILRLDILEKHVLEISLLAPPGKVMEGE